MLEPLDKAILTAIYVSSLEPEMLPLEYLKVRTPISEDQFNVKIKEIFFNLFIVGKKANTNINTTKTN